VEPAVPAAPAVALGTAIAAGPVFTASAQPDKDRRFYIAPMATYGAFGDTQKGGPNVFATPPGGTVNPSRNIPVGAISTDADFDAGFGGTIAIGKPISGALNFELYAFKIDGVETIE
jgi:hypothetical protein